VVGSGAVGSRVARQLMSLPGESSVLVVDPDRARGAAVAEALGPGAAAGPWSARSVSASEVVVLASPGLHHSLAEQALDLGVHVVSVTDDDQAARRLLELDGKASGRGCHLVVGAGFSPGLSCVLARHAAHDLERVHEIRVARWGSGGPACARGRQKALASVSTPRWRLGPWMRSLAGTGRELCWFPEPVGGQGCAPARVADPLLLAPAFPDAEIVARIGATRRERYASLLPPIGRPQVEGTLGAVRVEVRGTTNGEPASVVLGAVDRPAVAAGTVAAIAASWAVAGRLARPGAAGLAEMVTDPVPLLHELAQLGVRAAVLDAGNGDRPGQPAQPGTGRRGEQVTGPR